MDFKFTEAQLALQSVAREFAEKEVQPLADIIDKEHRYPAETFAKMAEIGFNGICTPVEYGGSGGNDIDKVIIIEEIAKKCASTAAILSVHTIFAAGILKFGTEAQKKKYLPLMAGGGWLGAFALTEPNAGSDAAAARTSAIYDEKTGEYVLNGTKCFISGGGKANALIVFALTDPSKGIKSLTGFIVEKGMPGFSIGKIENKMGLHGSETVELIFDNCRVPKENMLGKEGKGFSYAMMLLDGARIGIAAQGLGIAEGALDESIKYMHERVQFGKPIAALQGIQWYIADMVTKIQAAKWLVFYAAYLKSAGENFGTIAAMAKYNSSICAREVANLGLQIHGGYGYMNDYPMERIYRDAKITEIYEGTSEIHKLVISRAVLG
ncbi:MAG: acyl-CoA dehydrogenase family protein [Fusobacteriaceae bacterium]|jgi:alkylation response protein AidB-like acyl-CoA dehydrogenase|nr:acyl-CoA dehydrogenase family protein [Fusobacteriaceae bacterium]